MTAVSCLRPDDAAGILILCPAVRVTIARPKNESAEEKKARKQAVKAERQARRSDKKATKERFSKEVRQQAQTLAQREQTKMRKL